MLISETGDYKILDTGDGSKLERWGDITLCRPDPQVIWPKTSDWRADAEYIRYPDGGEWQYYREIPERWAVKVGGLDFYVRPTGFKHTGLFPEQAANWSFMAGLIKKAGRPINVLNLFAYTGGATLACAKAGASVCHVDAAKSMVAWAKENAELSKLKDAKIRYFVDDCLKFVLREQRRGNFYDGIIMDPPSYGRGSGGEVWKLADSLFELVSETAKLLSEKPLFFILNSYTTGLSPTVSANIIGMTVGKKCGGSVVADELCIPIKGGKIFLPCGTTARWTP